MTRRTQPALVGLQEYFPQAIFFHLDRRDLEYIVKKLNRKLEEPTEALIRLMERLKEGGGNLKKMMAGDPQLEEAVAEVCVTRWMPSTNRRAHLVLQPSWEHILKPEPLGSQMRPERFAALLFHVGTLNPEWDKVAGPCARCGNYYIKKRASQDVYCSRRCGNAATAVTRTRERIKAEHDEKMNLATAAIREWKRAKTQQDWKRWVSQKTGIDLRFLTRNFNASGGTKLIQKEQ